MPEPEKRTRSEPPTEPAPAPRTQSEPARKRRSRRDPNADLERQLELKEQVDAVTERIRDKPAEWGEYTKAYADKGDAAREVVEYAEADVLMKRILAGESARKVYRDYRRAVDDEERTKRVIRRVSKLMRGQRPQRRPSREPAAPVPLPDLDESRGRSRSRGAGEVGGSASVTRAGRSRSRLAIVPVA
jgi:hypothetical protein